MIRIQNLHKSFPQRSWRRLLRGQAPVRVEALRGLSLEVARGELLGLLGPNGAGKTTLIKILATLVTPEQGEVAIAGCDIRRAAPKVRRMIGLVNTNERSFYWRLSGRQNLAFFARLYNLHGDQLRKRLDTVLALTGLTDKADSPFMGWSTGQRQRLGIARALLSQPELLLFDEPTSSLDPVGSAELIAFVKEQLVAGEGKTVIWCSHDLHEAEQVSDRIAMLHQGRLVMCGSLDELRRQSERGSRTLIETGPGGEEQLAELPFAGELITRSGERQTLCFAIAEAENPRLVASLQQAGVAIYTCRSEAPSLEQLFAQMVTEPTVGGQG